LIDTTPGVLRDCRPVAYQMVAVSASLSDPLRERSRFVRTEDWTKGREFSSLRVPRRHSWARTLGISSVILSVPKNSS